MSQPDFGDGADAPPKETVVDPAPVSIPWYRWPTTRLRKLYDWTLSWAGTRYAVPALAVLAFLEASFFPIPPDVLLMAMCLGKPKRAFQYAAVCTIGSVLGGLLGFYIGVSLWRTLGVFEGCPDYAGGAFLFQYVPGFSCEKFATVQHAYQDNAWLALFTAAFTPIPYKVFTIAAGVFQVALPTLIAASIVGRGARFTGVAALIYFFGPSVRTFIERRFELLTLVFTVLLVGGFALFKYAM
jgi:membrane protein YqaA with SNARE-associated domain